MPRLDFQVTKESRKKYEIENSLFSINGDLLIANFRQARILANKINANRRNENKSDKIVTPGVINAIGLQHEIFHYVIKIYEETENRNVLNRVLGKMQSELGEKELEKILLHFIEDFPPPEVYSDKITAKNYLNGANENKPNREIILEELLLLNIGNNNPAAENLKELYDDTPLGQQTDYLRLIRRSEKFFENEKRLGPENLSLTQFLRKPIEANPFDLDSQLEFIRKHWAIYIKSIFDDRLLRSKDLFAEDARIFQLRGFHKGTPPVPDYDSDYLKKLRDKIKAGGSLTEDESRYYYAEYEHFTADIEWMPKVVMIAKNIFVWLDQLSRKYLRTISRLDQIPDEELNDLARWNFTALWLIGIWERSSASRKIKQLTGNPEAASSAYSLFDYVIANELGGEDAFQNLKHRAWQRGIRISSDMVPNHTGIFSKWIIEHPEYFIQNDYPPFPNYTFNGPNLSDDPGFDVRIEDKYYSREDAAVVFQRKDNQTGEIKYIYHGNDGTSMPWNDTAQLNLLKPEVRESLIQTIMHVARKTPIIRFDAAMTLTKKHYARLWFPQPGAGGAIPSRSDHSLSRSEFDAAMPNEFWREVVDRINREMPETLLLAEAFWLMEGYFVRTLGMHRVYNSAFMHMMMKEENNKFRNLIKNTLEFNPEILKRYVNFMSNPDEDTAINQFGDGDKYFGVAVMMITLPGLPMFGHGQIEGYKEKYGMEYKRSYYDETRNDGLVRRHEWEIFPLMQKRYLYSQVENFELYDFYDYGGFVNENVFAFSNRSGNERSLVIYNNSYNRCGGTISHSAMKINTTEEGVFASKKISEALFMNGGNKYFYTYRDHRTKLEYIISGESVWHNGLNFNLDGYQYLVLQEFREIYDHSGIYERLYYHLNGSGVQSIENELREMNLAPVHLAFNALFEKDILKNVETYINGKLDAPPDDMNSKIFSAVNKVNEFAVQSIETSAAIDGIHEDLNSFRKLALLNSRLQKRKTCPKWYKQASENFPFKRKDNIENDTLIQLIILHNIFHRSTLHNLFDHVDTYRVLSNSLRNFGLSEEKLYITIFFIKTLTGNDKYHLWNKTDLSESGNEEKVIYISDLFYGENISGYLNIHEYKGIKYFNKENFEKLLDWLFLISSAACFNQKKETEKASLDKIRVLYNLFSNFKIKAEESGYEILKLKELLLNSNGKAKKIKAPLKRKSIKKKIKKN